MKLLLVMLMAASAQPATDPAKVLERDRLILQGALTDWDAHLKTEPGGAPFLAELDAFKGRTKRAKSLQELRPIEIEFDAWKRATAAKLQPGAVLAQDGWIDMARGQVQANNSLNLLRKNAVPSEVKAIDGWRKQLWGIASSEDLSSLFDRMGKYRPGPSVTGTSVVSWAGASAGSYAPTMPTAKPAFHSDVKAIALQASVPPPNMVEKGTMPSYQKMVAYLTEVAHKSGLYQKLVNLGVDPLPFMLALVKSESDFYQRAVSPAGAYGYMQVLVPTAKSTLASNRAFYESMTGEKLHTGAISGQTLLDNWKMNIIAGTLYLRSQVDRFDSLVTGVQNQGKMLINLIASAYNAGEGGLTKFLLGKKSVSWSEVENVENMAAAKAKVQQASADPHKSIVGYKETRGYVSKIQQWYDSWRGSWASWRDQRMPVSA